eukprot:TRINITY_DN13062_c0_g2_i1.p1 TRINITY_DN13062_c0_g2~~TRINITY_DN13062_c0_g2_i1.p1  ORF type:complete len:112 (-),score=24.02 TRINITY_DN13062_c0_g2_i1:295-630(-)
MGKPRPGKSKRKLLIFIVLRKRVGKFFSPNFFFVFFLRNTPRKNKNKTTGIQLMKKIFYQLTFISRLKRRKVAVKPHIPIQSFLAFGLQTKDERALLEESKKWEPPRSGIK